MVILRSPPAITHPQRTVRNDNFHLNCCRSLKMTSAKLLHPIRNLENPDILLTSSTILQLAFGTKTWITW